MVAKFLFILISFALAGSQFESSASSILAAFNEKIELGDIHSLQSFINTNSKYIQSRAVEDYRNRGLILAVQKRHASVVELLLKEANVDAASSNNRAIRLAAANGNVDIVKMLLNRQEVNPGVENNEPLISAAKNGHTEIVRLLLSNPKVDPSNNGGGAVFEASLFNHADIVKLLIRDGRADSTTIAIHTLERAAHFENVDLVRFLLTYPSFTRIVNFILVDDDLKVIKTVVEAGYTFDQNTIDRSLQYAKSRGNLDIVEYLESLRDTPKLPDRPLISMTEQCAICLEDSNIFEGFMTFCQHQFHAGCLQNWIEKNNSCPMCRSSTL